MVTRAELDAWLLSEAAAAGAEVRVPCRVVSVSDDVVETDAGPLRASVVIAADGTSSRLAREVGVRLSRVDLGLELELEAGSRAGEWADRVHLDWGPIPGSYAWVFPKGDTLTVGVIAARGAGEATRGYLRDFVRWVGLDGLRVVHDSGHLTRCRTPDVAARPGPGAARRRRRRAARAVDPRGHLVRHPLRCAGRHGRGGGAVGRGRALPRGPRRRSCCPRWPPASAACAPSRPGRGRSTS